MVPALTSIENFSEPGDNTLNEITGGGCESHRRSVEAGSQPIERAWDFSFASGVSRAAISTEGWAVDVVGGGVGDLKVVGLHVLRIC